MTSLDRTALSAPRLDARLIAIATCGALPAFVIALGFLWIGPFPTELRWTLALVVVGSWAVSTSLLRHTATRPIEQIGSMLTALAEGEYSIRAWHGPIDSPLGFVFQQINALGTRLHTERASAVESAALLSHVVADVAVAVFAFDPERRLVLANRAAQALMKSAEGDLLGKRSDELDLDQYLGSARGVVNPGTGGQHRRYEYHRSTFYREGRPHLLLVMTDVSEALREEELAAWQRIVRVLSHEVNNSLTPIKSLANSMSVSIQALAPFGGQHEIQQALSLIETRAGALGRFLRSYAQLAKLPRPEPRRFSIEDTVRHVVGLETRLAIAVDTRQDVCIEADRDQIEQALINLVRNAVDSALEAGGGVRIHWTATRGWIDVSIDDEGNGVQNLSNLFVPFFTTKHGGAGIGLVLSRQIAESHGGTVILENRPSGGCRATLRLPLPSSA